MNTKNEKINEEIKVELTNTMENTTPYAGVLATMKFFRQSGFGKAIDAYIGARSKRGASDSDHFLALVTLQTCGFDAFEDLKLLPAKIGALGLKIPSVTAARKYAECFANDESESARCKGSCYIPKPNKYLAGLDKLHTYLFDVAHRLTPKETITLDQDATYMESERGDSLCGYQGFRGYEAFNTYCCEYDMMVGTQFRDANVNPGYGQLDELKRILATVPAGVKKVQLRSDSAGYQTELLRYCAEGQDPRFGVIDFAISSPVRPEFIEVVKRTSEDAWHPLRDESGVVRQEWAEVAYVPSSLSTSKNSPEIRFFAIRELLNAKKPGDTEHNRQGTLFPEQDTEYLEESNPNIKKLHPTDMSGKTYKVFGLASNILDRDGEWIIRWSRLRCGKSEEAHAILKSDFGGSHVPSHKFGANAFWWHMCVLAMSVNNIIKRFFLPDGLAARRMKGLRASFYTVIGKIVRHARKTTLKLSSSDIGALLLVKALKRMEKLLVIQT